MPLFNPKEKGARLAALSRLAGNNDEPKVPLTGRPVRLLRRQEVRAIDKPMTFTDKKLKPIY